MSQRPPPAPDMEPFLSRASTPPGWHVVYEPVVSSTNDLAREAAARGWPDRSVFACDYQSSGRGRQGRVWMAPPGSALLMSVLFRGGAQAPLFYTMLCSVSSAEAIERHLGIEVQIKWPNDLMVDDRKVAGVLAEAASGPEGGYVVVGLGVNVNLAEEDLAHLPPAATSLRSVVGREVHRGELLILILEQMNAWLSAPHASRLHTLWQAWHRRLWRRNQRVRLVEQAESIEGVVEGAQVDGTLLIRCADGSLRRIISGEIIL